ncbi:glycoside hydrolase family 99-like domain-containing protein [Flavihumibacter sp. ZG627]|uniref:glycosyltransferase WbsX family protein n=1 Tax=Flavihumibacter sp. ZG627 TaxID=1463156 RepID=UPI00057F63FC|nr:glycoside hydrolase family 99-like domain-containing protein [Flavihumibacter sp. ZG627]KIC92264.1 glycosyl hydrolase [Flavihumibacter sp. ZG627]
MSSNSAIRPIAIHLPQFHPFVENDEWWGKGFTEWTNVTRAQPQFPGHYQPHLPSDLGFYDLRLKDSLIAQAELAKAYGIYGFCYYHYWFNGKRLMHQPLDLLTQGSGIGMPFMYCWANENWSRRWNGDDTEILIKQEYSITDDIAHINYLLDNVFSHPDYISVFNKPFFAIYRPSLFPDIKATIETWRTEALKKGVELYIGYMQGFQLKEDPNSMGFDVAIDFQPNFYVNLPQKSTRKMNKYFSGLFSKGFPDNEHRILSYKDYVVLMKESSFPAYNFFPSITPMWDNTARRKKGAFIFEDSDPELYYNWLVDILNKFTPPSSEENFIFINAWNEWAEGNHLEPCQKWGRSYLEATCKALKHIK